MNIYFFNLTVVAIKNEWMKEKNRAKIKPSRFITGVTWPQ